MATNLSTLINAIPQAEAGKLITADYHNTLRDALQALADQLQAHASQDHGSVAGASKLVLPPCFIGGENLWDVERGATDLGDSEAVLSLPLQLRDNETPLAVELVGCVVAGNQERMLELLEKLAKDPDLKQQVAEWLAQRLPVRLHGMPMNEEQAQVLDATFTLGTPNSKKGSVPFTARIDVRELKKLRETRMLKLYLSVRQQVVDLKRAERLFEPTELPLRFTLWGVVVHLA